MFVIKVCDDVKIVGHLSIEISRPKKYLLDRGAVFTIELTFTNYRLFPLIQGGLEIPAKLPVTMPGLVKNHLLMEKYKERGNGVMLNQKMMWFQFHFWLYQQLDKGAREIRDLEKARNGERRPKKTITEKVKTSDSFFVNSRKIMKARFTWLWKKEKIKQTLIQLL